MREREFGRVAWSGCHGCIISTHYCSSDIDQQRSEGLVVWYRAPESNVLISQRTTADPMLFLALKLLVSSCTSMS